MSTSAESLTAAEADVARLILDTLRPLPLVERVRVVTLAEKFFGLDAKPASGRRKPGITTLIKRAEKSGRRVTSVTTPDGTTLTFGDSEPSEANNPWLADLKVTKQ
jgi:hypothetical protein